MRLDRLTHAIYVLCICCPPLETLPSIPNFYFRGPLLFVFYVGFPFVSKTISICCITPLQHIDLFSLALLTADCSLPALFPRQFIPCPYFSSFFNICLTHVVSPRFNHISRQSLSLRTPSLVLLAQAEVLILISFPGTRNVSTN